MRLKDDASNWNASNVQRKLKEIPDLPALRSTKNTRRWCKGKVGRDHEYQITDFKVMEGGEWTWHKRDLLNMKWACVNCRKQNWQWFDR